MDEAATEMSAGWFDKGGLDYNDELFNLPNLPESQYLDKLSPPDRGLFDIYREQGFVAVRSAITESAVREALSALKDLAKPGSGAKVQYEAWAENALDTLSESDRLNAIRKITSFVERSPFLRSLAYDPQLLSLVESLLGGPASLYWDEMALLKAPGGREKPWHQDSSAIMVPPGTRILGLWIALDEATKENGCMCVARGSHLLGFVHHVRSRDRLMRSHEPQICERDLDLVDGFAIPLQPGGALLFDGLLQHGTAANRSSMRRWSLQFHYTLASAQVISLEAHNRAFGIDADAQC